MADNTTITPGAGTTIATDDVGGVHYQKMKMFDPTDDSSTGIGIAANPLRVDPTGSTAQPVSGTLTGITNSIAVHVGSTGGTLSVSSLATGTVAISAKDGSFAVYFSPSSPSLNTITRVDRVINLVDGTLSTVTRTDRVMNLVDGTISAGTLDFVSRVRNVVDGTLTTVSRVDRVINVVDGTLSTVARVSNVVDGTLSTVARVSNVVDGTLSNVYRVHNLVAGTVTLTGANTTLAVYFDRGDPGVNVSKFNGGAAVTPNTGIPAVNVYATTSIFTVSGSTSGVSVSGVNLVAPSANYNFKVFAYSVQTTALVSLNVRFVNGSGASQTEFWRPLVTPASSSSLPVGAVMAVQPPGYIFATGTNVSLNILLDSASLVHYSVSYIKESA